MATVDVQDSSPLGFSAQTRRFQTIGLHPELLTRIQLQSSPNIAPGSYDLLPYGDFSERNLVKNIQGPNWQQGLYTEQMAKIPLSSFKETHERRKEDERRLGPGTYEIDDFLTEGDRKPVCKRGALEQLAPRFPKEEAVRTNFPPFACTSSVVSRTERHHQPATAYLMKRWSASTGSKVVQCLRLNGDKGRDHYHFR